MNLFDESKKSEEVILPHHTDGEENIPGMKKKEQFNKAISSDVVPKVLIAGGGEMEFPSYLIDYENASETTVFQRQALSNLVDGETGYTVYIRISGKVYKLGTSSKLRIEELIDMFKDYVLDDCCKIWKYNSNTEAVEVKKRDITKIRLGL